MRASQSPCTLSPNVPVHAKTLGRATADNSRRPVADVVGKSAFDFRFSHRWSTRTSRTPLMSCPSIAIPNIIHRTANCALPQVSCGHEWELLPKLSRKRIVTVNGFLDDRCAWIARTVRNLFWHHRPTFTLRSPYEAATTCNAIVRDYAQPVVFRRVHLGVMRVVASISFKNLARPQNANWELDVPSPRPSGGVLDALEPLPRPARTVGGPGFFFGGARHATMKRRPFIRFLPYSRAKKTFGSNPNPGDTHC